MPKRTLLYPISQIESVTEKLDDNPIDVLHLGVPLFIRLLEWAYEHTAKDDEDLHRMTERLTLACKDGNMVGMEVYNEVTGTIEVDKVEAAQETLDTLKNDRPDDIEAYADKKNRKYLIDTHDHTKAAWSYINMPKNASKYTAEELKAIKENIKKAAKKFDIEIHEHESSQETLSEEEITKNESLVKVNEYIDEMNRLNTSIQHLTKVRSIVMKHDVSAVLMQAIDPNSELVEAGICCSYEELVDVPKMYFDSTIDGINTALEHLHTTFGNIQVKIDELTNKE